MPDLEPLRALTSPARRRVILGYDITVEEWMGESNWAGLDEMVPYVLRTLCLPVERESEVRADLEGNPPSSEHPRDDLVGHSRSVTDCL